MKYRFKVEVLDNNDDPHATRAYVGDVSIMDGHSHALPP